MLGADAFCATLEALGVECVFGVPGTQTVSLYEALRRSSIRSVLPTHELAAAFMANGYYRASGRVGVLLTIPGPGFTYALTGIAEARLDSAAVLHVVTRPANVPGKAGSGLQALDQAGIAGPLVKRVFEIGRAAEIPDLLAEAFRLTRTGEPGPVLVQIAAGALAEPAPPLPAMDPGGIDAVEPAPGASFDDAAAFVAAASRPVIYAGQGALDAAPAVRILAESRTVPVFTTPSARGVIPEDHPLALGFDVARTPAGPLNDLIRASDCVLALGCKFSHNGTAGFALALPPDRLVHVNADPRALGAGYPARIAVHGRVEPFLERILRAADPARGAGTSWSAEELRAWRERLRDRTGGPPEPVIHGTGPATPAAFFDRLRRALPGNGILVTDSGLHQILARRHFDVLSPRGLILPSDFQSMGFGLPAALGARLAAPDRPVAVILGDGGFAMSGMELATAVRERIAVTVIVFNDGHLNLIRLQQFGDYGRAHAVSLRNPDLAAFAAAIGMEYARVGDDVEVVLARAVTASVPTLVEVRLGDSAGIRKLRARSLARETVRSVVGPSLIARLKAIFHGSA